MGLGQPKNSHAESTAAIAMSNPAVTCRSVLLSSTPLFRRVKWDLKKILRIFDIVLYEFPWLDIMSIDVFAGFVFYRIADSFSGCSIDDSKINLRGTIIGLVIRGHILNGRVWITRQTGFCARRVFDIAGSMECNGRTVIIGSRQAPFVLITSSHHHCMLAQHRVIGRVSSSQRIHDSPPFGVTG